ncbi:DUF4194 domain-containing protein [Desulfoscipio geothermicus]|uniref:DUF4194 domain-containing protein n=1 Tax=Desulfoscipio geothermicus DSM 3669 TaxID=1121426 RepID=A0A1I6D569_9FIRM|nr:DUF4194 domain-containing protein [Desulfoscipio geothermicus]SFR00560.1 protein of unknown function [Desulfoscipio geothermicus DSM 3669]
MSWYREYGDFSDKDKETFRKAANLLLSQNYLVYEREEDRLYYRFVERYLDIFIDYFFLSGWDLHHDKRLFVFQLYNRYGKNRCHFTLQETIFLFILRLLYDEKQKDLRLTREILISGEDIQQKYMALEIKNRLPARDDMEKALKLFSNFSILDLKRGQWKDPDAVYILYPSLLLVVDVASVERLATWIKANKAKGDEDDVIDRDKAD